MSEPNDDLTTDERTEADKRAVGEVIGKGRIAIVTTVADDSSLVSRPLAVVQKSFDGDLYFFAPDPSDKRSRCAGTRLSTSRSRVMAITCRSPARPRS